jgi:glyoxylase-like metal-dependent hydrolase (beta-lactamase superfamily II)
MPVACRDGRRTLHELGLPVEHLPRRAERRRRASSSTPAGPVAPLIAAAERNDITPTHVLLTHHHGDHVQELGS